VHTNAEGADLNARVVIAGLKALRENALIKTVSAEGRAIEIAAPETILMRHLHRSASAAREDFLYWLNLPEPADASLASLFLIGDSTVRNGRGDGIDGQWGWGDPLAAYFDPAKVNVVNRRGGRHRSAHFPGAGILGKRPGDAETRRRGDHAVRA
jgi:hypothetical protein